MENVLGLLIVAVSFILAGTLVVAAMSGADTGVGITKNAIAEAQKLVSVEDADFSRVKSSHVTGMEAVQLLQKFDDSGYGHLVVTSGKPEGFYSIDGITDVHSDNYINPDKVFTGTVVTNANDVVYAVRLVENGLSNVKFDVKEASKVPASLEHQIKEAQYSLFSKFLVNRVKCNAYMQVCYRWAEALKRLDSAEMRGVYTKYAKDSDNQREYMESQVLSFEAQIRFYDSVTEQVKLWTENKWWEAILSADLDSSSEDLNPGTDDDWDDSTNWWEEPDDSFGDNKVDDSDSDSDSEDSEGANTGDDVAVTFSPEPSASELPEVTDTPSVSEVPSASLGPGLPSNLPEESPEPVGTGVPDMPEDATPTPNGTTVPIAGPDST